MTEHPPLTSEDDDLKLTLVVKIKHSSAARLEIISQEWGINERGVLAGLLLDDLLNDNNVEPLTNNHAKGSKENEDNEFR